MSQDGTRRRTVTGNQETLQRERLLRPPTKTCKQKFRDFFWDPVNKTCMTRTPGNWLSISFYYACFLAVVFLLFYISMKISAAVVSQDSNRPQYILDDSPIGSAPSVNFFPIDGSHNLIWLSKSRSYTKYVDIIKKTFKKYRKANKKFNATTQFGECGSPPFGYDTNTPCLYFRLNRVLMWTPTPYEKGDDYPDDMPPEVQALIEGSDTPKVWLTCNGTTAKDRDHISQDFFQIIGEKGFSTSAFPYEKQKNYVDAIIPIKLIDKNPNGVLYSFTCTVWMREVDPSKVSVDVSYYFE